MREDGQPFSSLGLIWAHYGREYLAAMDVPADDIEAIHAKFDTKFVLPIDLLDNGAMEPSVAGSLSIMTLPALLGSLKPVFDDTSPTANDDAFFAALSIARSFVEAQIRGLAANARSKGIVLEAISKAGTSAILELPIGMPYRSALEQTGADHILKPPSSKPFDAAVRPVIAAIRASRSIFRGIDAKRTKPSFIVVEYLDLVWVRSHT